MSCPGLRLPPQLQPDQPQRRIRGHGPLAHGNRRPSQTREGEQQPEKPDELLTFNRRAPAPPDRKTPAELEAYLIGVLETSARRAGACRGKPSAVGGVAAPACHQPRIQSQHYQPDIRQSDRARSASHQPRASDDRAQRRRTTFGGRGDPGRPALACESDGTIDDHRAPARQGRTRRRRPVSPLR